MNVRSPEFHEPDEALWGPAPSEEDAKTAAQLQEWIKLHPRSDSPEIAPEQLHPEHPRFRLPRAEDTDIA